LAGGVVATTGDEKKEPTRGHKNFPCKIAHGSLSLTETSRKLGLGCLPMCSSVGVEVEVEVAGGVAVGVGVECATGIFAEVGVAVAVAVGVELFAALRATAGKPVPSTRYSP
jgi:hypothetical protein